jgi:hypothetical protein
VKDLLLIVYKHGNICIAGMVGLTTPLPPDILPFFLKLNRLISISYPEASLIGSGHTGLKNDSDWSIHKLYIGPIPPVAFASAANMSEYDIFCFILPDKYAYFDEYFIAFRPKKW